jgi:hypothetical protein
MEMEWLKECLSCSEARELRKLVDHDHPDLSVSRQCLLLVWLDRRSTTGPYRYGSRCAKVSSTWWRLWIVFPGTYSAESYQTALTHSSVWMP